MKTLEQYPSGSRGVFAKDVEGKIPAEVRIFVAPPLENIKHLIGAFLFFFQKTIALFYKLLIIASVRRIKRMGRKAKKRNITDKLLIKISDDMKKKDLTLIQYAVNVLDCTPQTLTNWFREDRIPSSKRKAIEARFKRDAIEKLVAEIKGE